MKVKNAVRQRSIPLEHSECHNVKVGDLVLCFQVVLDAFFLLIGVPEITQFLSVHLI